MSFKITNGPFAFKTFLYWCTHNVTFSLTSFPFMFVETLLSKEYSVTIVACYLHAVTITIVLKTRETFLGHLCLSRSV